jgi:hypothetical protein
METKVCNTCKIEKDINDFGHRKQKTRGGKIYVEAKCKRCQADARNKKYAEDEEYRKKKIEYSTQKYWEERNAELPELLEKLGKVKICSHCGFEGDVKHFAKGEGNSEKDAVNKGRLKGVCKKCRNKQQAEYRKNNPDMFKKIHKKTYNRRKKDPEFIKAKKEHSKEYSKRPEVRKRNNKAFNERRKKNGTYHTRRLLTNTYNQIGSKRPPNQRTAKLIGYTGLQLLDALGEKPKGKKYDIDHLIPLTWFKNGTPPIISCDLRNLEWKEHKTNIAKSNHYADAVDTEYFETIRQHIKDEYLYRFKVVEDKTIDTFKEKVLDLWARGESCMVLFGE